MQPPPGPVAAAMEAAEKAMDFRRPAAAVEVWAQSDKSAGGAFLETVGPKLLVGGLVLGGVGAGVAGVAAGVAAARRRKAAEPVVPERAQGSSAASSSGHTAEED